MVFMKIMHQVRYVPPVVPQPTVKHVKLTLTTVKSVLMHYMFNHLIMMVKRDAEAHV